MGYLALLTFLLRGIIKFKTAGVPYDRDSLVVVATSATTGSSHGGTTSEAAMTPSPGRTAHL